MEKAKYDLFLWAKPEVRQRKTSKEVSIYVFILEFVWLTKINVK